MRYARLLIYPLLGLVALAVLSAVMMVRAEGGLRRPKVQTLLGVVQPKKIPE